MKLTAVSYLNTKPFLYGIFQSGLDSELEISLDMPSVCARKLLAGEADLGLVPVAILPEMGESWLVSDFCIGSVGAVKTVCIFSEKPLAEIENVFLDFHSKTSVNLARLLFDDFWKQNVHFLPAFEGFEKEIKGTTAGLVIGDRAIGLEKKFAFVYDLAEAWTEWTSLPFVFAAWVSRRPLEAIFLEKFNAALRLGLDHIPQLSMLIPSPDGGDFDLKKYYTQNISYELNSLKMNGLELFLSKMAPDFEFGKLHRGGISKYLKGIEIGLEQSKRGDVKMLDEVRELKKTGGRKDPI